MKFTTIDTAALPNGDRAAFYFGFSENKLTFAGKKSVSGCITKIKASNYFDVIAWFGFDPLAKALFEAPNFKKRYNLNLKEVTPHLVVGDINHNPVFFSKTDSEWNWLDSIDEFLSSLDESAKGLIIQRIGRDFIQFCKIDQAEQAAQKKAETEYNEYKVTATETTKAVNELT